MSAKLREKLNRRGSEQQFDYVDYAFLELASPSIVEGVARSVERGVTDLLVVPYFLSAGRHVQEDIPNEIAKCERADVRIQICDYVGRAEGMVDLLAHLTRAPQQAATNSQ